MRTKPAPVRPCPARLVGNQRGVILPLIGVSMAAILASTAIGVGIGRLTLAATEVQNAADVAALAGLAAGHALRDPLVDAHAALAANEIASTPASSYLQEVVLGNFDAATRQFTAGADPSNSAMARVRATIPNPFGGLIQQPMQDVEKVAYAALSGLSSARSTLPIVLGECNFVQDCFEDWCMPRLTMVPNPSDTVAWTGFFEGSSGSTVRSYVPTVGSNCGGGGKSVNVAIGDVISLNNGQITSVLTDLNCLVNSGLDEFLIPIVGCHGNFNSPRPIVGFATIYVERVVDQGGNKGIDLRGIVKTNARGGIGGPGFGTGNLRLVPVG